MGSYSLSANASSVNEGDNFSFQGTVSGSWNPGTILYWGLREVNQNPGFTQDDVYVYGNKYWGRSGWTSIDASGNFGINGYTIADHRTEGNHTIGVSFYTEPSWINEVASASLIINDTSVSSYSLSTSSSSFNEDDTVIVTVSAGIDVFSGTDLLWSASGSNITESDFSFINDSHNSAYPLHLPSFDSSSIGLKGSGFLGSDRTFTFSFTLASDQITEGSETINIKIFDDDAFLQQVATSSISIADSSNSLPTDFSGTDQDDSFLSTLNNEVFNGGLGTDKVTFRGDFEDYTFVRGSDNLQSTDIRLGTNPSFDGVDSLLNIELIKFSDQTVEESKVDIVKTYSGEFSDYKFYNKGNGIYQIKTNSGYDDITGLPLLTFTGEATTSSFKNISAIVDIKGTFDQVTGLNTDDAKMFRLYNASFKRLPDADGLKYWIGKYTSGENDERAVASSFLVSVEFKERYGENVSDSTYVNNLYKNVLGRDADTSGLNYWLGQLNTGAETRYEVLLGFSESAENKTLFTDITGFG